MHSKCLDSFPRRAMHTQRGEEQHMAMRDVSTLSWEWDRRPAGGGKSEMCDKMIKFIRRRQIKRLLSMKILLFTIHFNSLAASSTIWTAHFSSVDASDACHEWECHFGDEEIYQETIESKWVEMWVETGKFQISQYELFGTEKRSKKNVCN